MNDNEMKIEIRSVEELINWAFAIGCIVFSIWLAILLSSPSAAGFAALIIMLIPVVLVLILYYTRPTVVTANNEALTYTHLVGTKNVKLTDIEKLTCEPYESRTRYATYQRIRLKILTLDGEEYELNDEVNASKMLSDKLTGAETDIPLVRLYEFLKEKTKL